MLDRELDAMFGEEFNNLVDDEFDTMMEKEILDGLLEDMQETDAQEASLGEMSRMPAEMHVLTRSTSHSESER